ncbi:MAG: D-sedoheptulose 7-phosphate isomerase [Hyphomicrobiaceae bacterium]
MSAGPDLAARVVGELDVIAENMKLLKGQAEVISAAADLLVDSLKSGGKVMFCGNGGSAADAQHLAAELMGRYLKDRAPLPALALTVDTSALTAIANDYAYDEVFCRQLKGIGRAGDVLVGLSTSGNSANVVKAVEAAREAGIKTVALTGQGGGRLAEAADLAIRVPSTRTNSIQEMHIVVGHMLCGFIEDALC